MKAGERERVNALRLIVNELQKAVKDGGSDDVEVLQRERKRRLEAAEAYRDGGRDDLAAGEEREAELIAGYMPAQVSDEELHAIVGDAVAESGATLAGRDGQGDGARDAAGEGPRRRQARERRGQGEADALMGLP